MWLAETYLPPLSSTAGLCVADIHITGRELLPARAQWVPCCAVGSCTWNGAAQDDMCTPTFRGGAAAAPAGTLGPSSPHTTAVVELVHAVERAQQAENLLATYKQKNETLQAQCAAYEQVRSSLAAYLGMWGSD